MHKDQRRELERLQEALLEPQEDWLEEEDDSDEWLEEYFESDSVSCDVFNTDDTDVDLDDYSEAVHQGRRSGGCLVPIIVFLTLVLCALVGWLLWKQGVVG